MPALTRRCIVLPAIGSIVAIAALLLGAVPHAVAADAPVGLGAATGYGVLAGSTVTNTGATVVNGDLGLSPGSAVVGFPPGVVAGGVIHAADAAAALTMLDLTTAYDDAAGRATSELISADLAGRTLVGGVYTGGSLGLSGALTLDAQGDSSTVFVLQAASTLIVASGSSVTLINGANPCNVYWQVGASATIGSGAQFAGTVLALTSISAQTGATITGRLFARNGAVTLDTNTITRPDCATLAPTPTTTTTTSTTTVAPTTTASATSTTLEVGATTSTIAPGAASTTSIVVVTIPITSPGTSPIPTGTLPATGPGSGSGSVARVAAVVLMLGAVAVAAARRTRRETAGR